MDIPDVLGSQVVQSATKRSGSSRGVPSFILEQNMELSDFLCNEVLCTTIQEWAANSIYSPMHGIKTGGNVAYADISADTAN